MKNKKIRKVGLGMKPRGVVKESENGTKDSSEPNEVSALAAHGKEPEQLADGVEAVLEEGGVLEGNGEPGEPETMSEEISSSVAVAGGETRNLEDLMRDSVDTMRRGEDADEKWLRQKAKEEDGCIVGVGGLALKAANPLTTIDRETGKVYRVPEGETGGEALSRLDWRRLGERPDGTYGLIVAIPEGMIGGIMAQAESDKVTPEEWVSVRLSEMLEGWWQPAQGR
jgi:hypothetical protein